MKKETGKFSAILFVIVILALGGCGGGGDDSPDTSNTDTTTDTDIDTNTDTTTPAAVSGFDFTLSQGDFWEYGWDYSSSYTAAYGSSSSSASSNFRITLGDPLTIGDVTFYEMMLSGNTKSSEYSDLSLNGNYLAVSGNKIITLDADGTTQNTIFDAQTGTWPGSGFFTSFPSDTLFEASASTITNDYINQSAYNVSESASASQCEYFPSVGTICGGDYNENMEEREYYMAGIGPVGLYAYFSMSDWTSSDGGWSSSNTTNIGLTASSLRGDSVDYELEVEPNNLIAEATPIILPARVQGDSVNESYLGGTTAVSVGLPSVVELEPNDSPFAPQTVGALSSISGDVLDGDANTSVDVVGEIAYTATFEDWYEITLGTGNTLSIALNFPSTDADLDMYLFSLDGVSSGIIHASSIDDNIGTSIYSELINQYLAAGTYYAAIDGYTTPARADYTLDISTDSSVNIGDWFSFSVDSGRLVDIVVTGGPSFVLMDNTGATTLASGGAAAGTSITLDAGSYLIGVSDGGAYTLEVTLP